MSTCTVDRKQFQVRKIRAHASESKYALIECPKMDCFQLNTLSLYWFISIQYHLGHRYHRHPADFFLFIRVAPQRKFRRPGGIPDICHICYASALFRQKGKKYTKYQVYQGARQQHRQTRGSPFPHLHLLLYDIINVNVNVNANSEVSE